MKASGFTATIPEAIRNQDLMNSDDNPPSYIMNNENLEPDLYDFLICHINYTDSNGGYGAGYEIEVDVELTAVEDSEITINKAFLRLLRTSRLYSVTERGQKNKQIRLH